MPFSSAIPLTATDTAAREPLTVLQELSLLTAATSALPELPNCCSSAHCAQSPSTETCARDWTCPLTHELPLNPAAAEDGQVYEWSAISEHIQSSRGSLLVSPVTGEPMGPRLTTAFAVRATIATLVRSGPLRGELVQRWLLRLNEDAAAAEAARIVQSLTGAATTGRLGLWLSTPDKQWMSIAA